LTGAPTGTSNTLTLDIDVGGTDVVSYRYKIVAGFNDCANPANYTSNQRSANLNITDSISSLANGSIYVCAIGRDTAGNEQLTSNATVVSWTKATAGVISAAMSLLAVTGATVTVGSSLTVTLTGKDTAGNLMTVGGATVTFGLSGGTSNGTFSGTTDNNDGTYSATFTGVTAGTATTITATISGSPVTSIAPTITVVP
jgi:hypothetical protein